MTRAERIEELRLQIQALQVEERIAAWVHAHPGYVIASQDTGRGPRPWRCDVGPEQQGDAFGGVMPDHLTVRGKGATEEDARAHAFSIIFANEAAALNETKGT